MKEMRNSYQLSAISTRFLTIISLLFIIHCSLSAAAQTGRVIQNFDKDWTFFKGDSPGAEQATFDDSKWRKLDVPHDWSIEGPFSREATTSSGGGYLPSGIGWYRKSFTLPAADSKRKVTIEFDGVMANSDVWINGVHLGKRPFGYISFAYDLSKHLNFGGKPNIISVRADNTIQPASRWYTGAGIYRHVRLVSSNPVHFEQWSVYVSASAVTAQKATVKLQSKVVNQSAASGSFTVETTLMDPAGKPVKTIEAKQTVAAGKTVDFVQSIEVANPALWDIEKPNLYKAVTKIKSGKIVLDDESNSFGIRDAKFDAATGFTLNGKNLKIKGVCLHHDMGGLGAAVPLRAWERRLALLKEAGVNGIRTAHNPVAPEFLDLCDRMGFLVMDETFDTWTSDKPHGEKGYNLYFTEWWERDTRDMVLRDRNHPSIIIYSVGNEIHDNLNNPEGFKKYKDQQDLIHQLDPGRPVTMALFRPNTSGVYKNGFIETMDVVGQNYRENELVAIHKEKPNMIVIGTENGHGASSWLALRDNAFMAGQFLWTGVDYLGEEVWPNIAHGSGLFDRTMNWYPLGYQRQSWWSDKPVVHIVRNNSDSGNGPMVANWTPADLGTYDVARLQVYSNCEEVELFLNGKSLGSKPKPANDSPRSWETTFEKGTIKAVGKNGGKEVASESYQTAGEPAKIILKADKSNIANSWDDVSYITATIVDANGIVCPNVTTDKLLTFSVSGTGAIAALDNGDITSHESFQGTERSTYKGICIAVIRAKAGSGSIEVKATAPGIAAGTTTITIE